MGNSGGSQRDQRKPDPPQGPFYADAVLLKDEPVLDTKSQKAKNESAMDILSGRILVNVLAKDPHTGELIRLDGIEVKRTPGTLSQGMTEGQQFKVKVPDYDALKRREISRMEAEPAADPPVIQNKSLPTPVKQKNSLDSFANFPSPICKKFKQAEEEAKKRMGLIVNRDDVTIVQGKKDGRSPGILVHQGDGKVYMFDNSGKQYQSLDSNGMKMVVGEIDTGSAREGRDAFGMPIPMEKNPMANYTPQGTILTPQPKLIPHITKFLNTMLLIRDMIDLVKCCSEAVKVIRNSGTPTEKKAVLNKAEQSSFVNDMYGDSKNTEDERAGKPTTRYDKYKPVGTTGG